MSRLRDNCLKWQLGNGRKVGVLLGLRFVSRAGAILRVGRDTVGSGKNGRKKGHLRARFCGGYFGGLGSLFPSRWGRYGHYSTARQAFVDIDDSQCPTMRSVFAVLHVIGLRSDCVCFERTKRGWHVIVYLRTMLEAGEIIALQAILGSDNRREALNLRRAISMRRLGVERFWERRWNILYRGKL